MADLTADVGIVGAGPVGAALACRLATAGMKVALIDRAPLPPMEHPAFDGRAYAIAAGSRGLLEAAGVWAGLPQAPCAINDIRITDGRIGRRPSPLFLHFDHREVVTETLESEADAFGWIVEARSLRVALNARLHDLPVRLFAPAEAAVRRFDDHAVIQVAGGPEITCRLVVAADGRESRLRREAGIAVTKWPYGQSAVVCAVAHERPHDHVALEHFLPSGPFAQLPMSPIPEAANLSALVWTDRHDRAARFMAMDDAAFAAEIQRRLGDHLGAVRPIGRRWSYPLGALFAHRTIDTRLALVGDAAHGIHPIAGQGLNLGFRDLIALAALVIGADDPGAPELLRRYQMRRRPDNMMMLAATDALDRLFRVNLPPVRLARDLGLAAVQRLPRLKQFFMKTAMGI